MIVSLSRPGADLVIGSHPTDDSPYWLDEDGVIEPQFDPRNTFADESPDIPGSLLLQSVLGYGTLGLTVYTVAADADTLKAQKIALETAVRQFSYTATLTLFGDPDAYVAMPGQVTWGTVDSGMVRALIAKAVVSILVQPNRP